MSEIAAASSEQAQGIDQVNKTVAEIDKVIQQNAANAEESASASQEMTSQANQLGEIVFELGSLVSGSRSKNGEQKIEKSKKRKFASGSLPEPEKEMRTAKIHTLPGREVSPDQVIPLDDDF